jgi:hypothetical protein
MGLSLLYWILMLIWLVFSVWWHFPIQAGRGSYWPSHVFLYVLMLILGWAVFGAPVRG